MKIFIDHRNVAEYVINLIKNMKNYIEIVNDEEKADASLTLQFNEKSLGVQKRFSNRKHYTYIFDLHATVLFDPRGYDWASLKSLAGNSDYCITVAEGQKQRIIDIFNISPDKIDVVKCYAVLFNSKISDEDYIFQPLRWYDYDPHNNWVQAACGILGIPYKISAKIKGNTGMGRKEYEETLAKCSFIVSPYWEHGSGGMSSIEAYNLGKPVLYSDSYYNAGHEYLGDRADYFKPDFDSFMSKISDLWCNRPKYDIGDCREFCKENYSINRMAKEISEILKREYYNGM